MFRVLGVTFSNPSNYGTALQAFSMQTVINSMTVGGTEPCSYELLPKTAFVSRMAPKRLKNKLIYVLHKIYAGGRDRKFSDFEKAYYHYADCPSPASLKLLNDRYDAFVCGSDVIWNFLFTKGDETYLLHFADKYKFSYAASFGRAKIEYPPTLRLSAPADEIYRRNLSRFNEVGVREDYARPLAEQFTQAPVSVVCDPTLLLTPAQWARYAAPLKKNRGKYIFSYAVTSRPNFTRLVERVAAETGLPVVNVSWHMKERLQNGSLFCPSPLEWITLLKDAAYVVTNSFHGTVFSVQFQKNLYVDVQGGRQASSNVRMYDFLGRLGLTDRLVPDADGTLPQGAPDYASALPALEEMRAEAMAFLQRNLDAAYEEKKRSEAEE